MTQSSKIRFRPPSTIGFHEIKKNKDIRGKTMKLTLNPRYFDEWEVTRGITHVED